MRNLSRDTKTSRTPLRWLGRTRPWPGHGHSQARCLKVLERLSAYVDGELSSDVCREVRKHLGACPKCEEFLDSLRQTVTLCRSAPSQPLSTQAKARIRREILEAVGAP